MGKEFRKKAFFYMGISIVQIIIGIGIVIWILNR